MVDSSYEDSQCKEHVFDLPVLARSVDVPVDIRNIRYMEQFQRVPYSESPL